MNPCRMRGRRRGCRAVGVKLSAEGIKQGEDEKIKDRKENNQENNQGKRRERVNGVKGNQKEIN